jgi:HAD superfamily hydrolase (TIGR01509 family)
MLNAIIFDMDGVLVQSGDAVHKSFSIILGRYGVDFEQIDKSKHGGRSLRDQLAIWKEDFPQIPEDLDHIAFGIESTKNELGLLQDELLPNEDILNLIRSAKDKRIKIAVATSSQKERAELFLKSNGIFEYLDAFVTSEDVDKHKPEPDIFLKAAKIVGVNPNNCAVIEDAVNGIIAANSAGMISVAHLTKYYKKEDFNEADYIFDDFAKLKLSDLEALSE